ncbi:MAG: hypothetical protein QW416_08670 [Candidatus Nitrosocaldaceae archaeon]
MSIGKRINKERAKEISAYNQFLNPAEDFIGVIEFLSEIRNVNTKNGEIEVVDARVEGYETRESEREDGDKTIVTRERVEYNGDYSLVLSKAVLASKIKKLGSLEGKRIVIIGLGKREEKNYLDYYIATEDEAIKDGVLIP